MDWVRVRVIYTRGTDGISDYSGAACGVNGNLLNCNLLNCLLN
jgi:hypothetical protein